MNLNIHNFCIRLSKNSLFGVKLFNQNILKNYVTIKNTYYLFKSIYSKQTDMNIIYKNKNILFVTNSLCSN